GKTLIVLFCSERGTERAFHGIVGRFGQSHIVLRGQSWPVVPRDIGELMTEMEWPNFVPKLLQIRIDFAHCRARFRNCNIIRKPQSVSIKTYMPFPHHAEVVNPNRISWTRIFDISGARF